MEEKGNQDVSLDPIDSFSPQSTTIVRSLSSKPKRSYLAVLVVALLVILFGSTGVFFYITQVSQKKTPKMHLESISLPSSSPLLHPSVSPTPIQYLHASTLDVPPLFPGLSWIDVNSENKRIGEYDTLYVTSEDGKYFANGAKLDGQEWRAEKIGLTENEFDDLKNKFRYYYETDLVNKGWRQDAKIPTMRLQAIIADGPNGGVWGYVGVLEGSFRVIVLEETFDGQKKSDRVNPGSCPCGLTFGIFVSNILSLDQILETIRS